MLIIRKLVCIFIYFIMKKSHNVHCINSVMACPWKLTALEKALWLLHEQHPRARPSGQRVLFVYRASGRKPRWAAQLPPTTPGLLPWIPLGPPWVSDPVCHRSAANAVFGPMGRPWRGSRSRPEFGRKQVKLRPPSCCCWLACPHLCCCLRRCFWPCVLSAFQVLEEHNEGGWWRKMVRYDEEIHDWMDEIQEYDDRCDGWDDQDMICDVVCMYLMLWLMFRVAVGFGGGTGQQRRAGGGVEEKWGVGE